MRIPINLASEPFRKDRPIVAASAALAAILVGLLCVMGYLILSERTRMRVTREEIARLSDQADKMAREQAQLDAVLRQPANAEVLERSLLLNALVERKSISWTRIFSDLEGVMPFNVRLIQVRLPQINSRNQVSLDMTVGAMEPGSVIQFMKRLETSPLFGPATLHTALPPSQNEPLFRYRISVDYAQKL
jgi:type IV pilus assembly protein PilN